MPIPSEIIEQLRVKMPALQLSNADLCRLVDWSSSQMSGFLKGERSSMGISEMNRVYTMVVELERLVKLVAPVPVDFSQTSSIHALLKQINKGQLTYYTSNEHTNEARFKIVITALDAGDREVQRAAAVSALIEGRV